MTDHLQDLISRYGESASIVPPVANTRPDWLETFTKEKRCFLRPKEGIKAPFPDNDTEYRAQCLEQVEYDVRVYHPDGHVCRIVLSEDYAQKLDAVRDVHLAAQYSGASLSAWSDHPLRHRARPEDLTLHLAELPDSSYINEICLLDWDNAFDPWLIDQGGCKSLAAATWERNVEFYCAELNGWLGLNVKHEWIHLAYARFRHLVKHWTDAVFSEWFEWLPDANALKSVEEHCALLGQMLMHRNGKEFLRGAINTPARSVVFFEFIEHALNAAAQPCICSDVWRNRIRVIRDEILPLAVDKAALRLQTATDLNAHMTARQAAMPVRR
jgi:hypothetical protein